MRPHEKLERVRAFFYPGTIENQPVKVLVRSIPKKVGIGKFEPGKKMEPETGLEVYYLKMWLNGEEIVEIDKLNFLFNLNGTNIMADIRNNLGLA